VCDNTKDVLPYEPSNNNKKSNHNHNIQKEITKSTISQHNHTSTTTISNNLEVKKPLEQLTIVDVGFLIRNIFPEIVIFQQTLQMNCVNGEVLNFCETAEDLIEIGIIYRAHARLILARINNYRDTGGVFISHFAPI
jgi:hypothetical protein